MTDVNAGSDRWRRIKQVFADSLALPPADRGRFIADACEGDERLRREIEALLASHDEAGDFFERSPGAQGHSSESAAMTAGIVHLSPGRRLGPYEIVAQLGAGGMGEVYRARDTRLNRAVAIKVLPAVVTADPDARQRLEREARAVAALNHPHICTLHDVGREDGVDFLLMEYLEGETLASRLEKGPLPFDQALEYAGQIASALDRAHRAGIVHRDLKPANLFLVRGHRAAVATVKLLDFGLAKSMRAAVAGVPGIGQSRDLTAPGLIVGTVRYMAPEQILGKEVDARTDIFAFGLVLFEMLTGRKPFDDDSRAGLMAAILEREPPAVSSLQSQAGPAVDRVVATCLAKDPDERWQTSRDLLRQLQWIADERSRARAALPGGVSTASGTRARRVGVLPFAALLIAATAVTMWALVRPAASASAEGRVTRFTVDLPKGLVLIPSFDPNLALSPDGTQLAIAAFPGPVLIRRLDALESRPLEATTAPGFRGAPLFSPDGSSISYIEGNPVFSWSRPWFRSAVVGGAPVKLADYDSFYRGDWGTDGKIYWTPTYAGGIVRTPESGGAAEPVTSVDLQHGERSHRFASLLPDGSALLYTVALDGIQSFDDARIDLWDLKTQTRKPLVTGGTAPFYSPSGHIVYARAGKLFAVPFDIRRHEVTGSPVQVLDGVLMSRNTGAAHFSLSRRGDLAYAPGGAEGGHRTLVWVDRSGKADAVPLPPASYLYPRIAPDGRSIAVEIEGPNHDLYLYDFARTVLTKITTDGLSHDPVWSPDGKRIAYRSWQGRGMTMWMMPADRSGAATRLDPKGTRQSPVSFSPDGKFLSFDQKDEQTADDAWVLPLEGNAEPVPVARTRFWEGSAKFSPDGRWIAYSSTESGKPEIYVQPFPGPGPKIQISNAGGTDPVWRREGGELFYRSDNKMMAVAVTPGSDFRASAPKQLWEAPYSEGSGASCGMPGPSSSNYDVTPDGQRFLMVRDDDSAVATSKVIVVLNWQEELKQRVPTRR